MQQKRTSPEWWGPSAPAGVSVADPRSLSKNLTFSILILDAGYRIPDPRSRILDSDPRSRIQDTKTTKKRKWSATLAGFTPFPPNPTSGYQGKELIKQQYETSSERWGPGVPPISPKPTPSGQGAYIAAAWTGPEWCPNPPQVPEQGYYRAAVQNRPHEC